MGNCADVPVVSTLLEILLVADVGRGCRHPNVSTLLEILLAETRAALVVPESSDVSTLLEILREEETACGGAGMMALFQPFLRFYRSCVRFLWVFKFFFGFL